MRLYTIHSYQVSNERAHHGWVQKKISNNRTPRWTEKAVSGAFVVNRVQKEYPNVLSQRADLAPSRPRCPRAAGVPGHHLCVLLAFSCYWKVIMSGKRASIKEIFGLHPPPRCLLRDIPESYARIVAYVEITLE